MAARNPRLVNLTTEELTALLAARLAAGRRPNLTVEELAAYCGVAVKTIYRWNHTGTGPARIQQGKRGKVSYSLAAVEEWERAHTRGGSPARA